MITREYDRVGKELSENAAHADAATIAKLGKRYASLGSYVELAEKRKELESNVKELVDMESHEREQETDEGDEMAALAAEERKKLQIQLQHVEHEIVRILTPKDEADDRGIVLEVRSGTGTYRTLTQS